MNSGLPLSISNPTWSVWSISAVRGWVWILIGESGSCVGVWGLGFGVLGIGTGLGLDHEWRVDFLRLLGFLEVFRVTTSSIMCRSNT